MRTALLNEIYSKLHVAPFRVGDFEVANRTVSRGHGFQITYRYDQKFRINGAIAESGGRVSGSMSPGELAAEEQFSVEGSRQFLDLVSEWAQRITQELAAVPISRAIEEQRQQIEQLLQQWQKVPNEYFTRDEADELRSRLEAIEQDFMARLSALDIDEKKMKAKAKEFEQDISFLKSELATLKKPGWARAFATRCVGWMRDPDNRALLKDGVEIGRKLLGSGSPDS